MIKEDISQDTQDTAVEVEPTTLERPPSFAERAMLLFITAAIIIVDHLSKLLVEVNFPLHSSWTPYPDSLPFIRITHVSNTGAAFGLFPGGSSLFMVVATIVSFVIIFYNFRLPGGHLLLRFALALQLGGALGNLVDRFRLGHVTDFMDIGPWPVFNVADASIVTGVCVLAYLMLLEHRQEQQQKALATAVTDPPSTSSQRLETQDDHLEIPEPFPIREAHREE